MSQRPGRGRLPLIERRSWGVVHVAGVFLDMGTEPCSDENGSAPAGALTAMCSPHREKAMVLDHGRPPSDPWAEYAAGSLERDIRSSRAEPVTTWPWGIRPVIRDRNNPCVRCAGDVANGAINTCANVADVVTPSSTDGYGPSTCWSEIHLPAFADAVAAGSPSSSRRAAASPSKYATWPVKTTVDRSPPTETDSEPEEGRASPTTICERPSARHTAR